MAERYHRHTMPLYWAAMKGSISAGSKEGSTRRDSAHTPMQYLFGETVVVRFSDGRNPGFIEEVVGSEFELAA